MGTIESRGAGRMNSCGLWEPKVNLSSLLLRGLRGGLLYITYGDNATGESMKTSILLVRLFFTSFVTMSDSE